MNYVHGASTVKDMVNIFPRNREKTDMILEPLQSIVQIGLLAFSVPGTKLAIQQNVLVLQRPSITQGIVRWYSGDKKDHLYYLFHVFRRFILWYNHQERSREFRTAQIEHQLYKVLLNHAYIGLTKLMETYQQCEMGSLVHVIQMYKMFLKKPEYFLNDHLVRGRRSLSQGDFEESRETESDIQNDTQTIYSEPTQTLVQTSPIQSPETLNIDMIFRQTKSMYSNELKSIIINVFELLEKCKEGERDILIDGLTKLMMPTTQRIQRWIQEHLVF